MEYQPPPSTDGKEEVKSKWFEQLVDIESIPRKTSSESSKGEKPNQKKRKFATLASSPKNNAPISKGKSKTSEKRNPITNYFQTLAPGSTSSGVISRGFWNKYSAEISKSLLLPEKTDYAVLDPTCWSSSLKRLGRNSWFSTQIQRPIKKNLRKISSRSQPFLWQEITGCVQQKIAKDEEKQRIANQKKRRKTNNNIKGEEK